VGSVFTRWGRTSCPQTTIYRGMGSGSQFGQAGGTSQHLCLPNNPDYRGVQTDHSSLLTVMEYNSVKSIFGPRLHHHNVPCAVCFAQRTSTVMIPGKLTCPAGWLIEYKGYLMSSRDNHHRAGAICIDERSESQNGKDDYERGSSLYTIKTVCSGDGRMECPPYRDNDILTCVVCSK